MVFKSFQRPGCNTSDSADIAHAPPENSPLGNTVSMQGQGPSHRQIVIAETRHLLGKQIHPPLNQNNPSKLKVCYLLLRTSPTHLARNRISPFRLHVPGFSKGNFRSRWGTFLYFGTSSIFKGKNNILMLMENPIFYLKPLLEIRRTYLSIGIEGWG